MLISVLNTITIMKVEPVPQDYESVVSNRWGRPGAQLMIRHRSPIASSPIQVIANPPKLATSMGCLIPLVVAAPLTMEGAVLNSASSITGPSQVLKSFLMTTLTIISMELRAS